jgi:hypothetical protein
MLDVSFFFLTSILMYIAHDTCRGPQRPKLTLRSVIVNWDRVPRAHGKGPWSCAALLYEPTVYLSDSL